MDRYVLPGPALGVEALRVLPEAGQSMGDPRAQQHQLPRFQLALPEGHRRLDDPAGGPDRRVEPHGLVDHSPHVAELGQVIAGGFALAEGSLHLRNQLAPDGRVLAEPDEGPGQGVGRRLVTGGDEGEHLVANLLAGQGLPLLVASRQEHPEHVVALVARRPSLVDEPIGEPVHRGDGLAEAAAAAGDPRLVGRDQPGDDALAVPLGRIEGRRELGRHPTHVGAEERLADDGERQLHHLLAEIDRLAPAVDCLVGEPDHGGAEATEPLAMEGGLHDAPMLSPVLSLAGQDALAQEAGEGLVDRCLPVERLHRRAQHLLHQLGLEDQVAGHRPEAERRQPRALVGRREPGQEGERILSHGQRLAEERQLGSGAFGREHELGPDVAEASTRGHLRGWAAGYR